MDNSGNVTITGQYDSSVLDANPGTGVFNLPNSGGADMFIINLDVNGGFLWAKQIGGSQTDYGNKVAIDNANNRIMVGQFQSSINVNVSTPSLMSTGTFNGLIIKYDASGNYKWAINLGANR